MRLASIAKLAADKDLTAAYPATQGAEVVLLLHNGKTVRDRMDDVVPATPAEVRARFRKAWGEAAAAIEEQIDALEGQEELSQLTALLGKAIS
jgi:hypothetical protein